MNEFVAVAVWAGARHGQEIAAGVGDYAREVEDRGGDWPPVISLMELIPRAESLARVKLKGLIVTAKTVEWLELIRRGGFPAVNVSGHSVGEELPSVGVDDVAAGRMAAEHLMERGFTHCACLMETGQHWAENRARGFRERLAEAGLDCSVMETERENRGENMEIWRWLEGLPKPVGVLVTNDWAGADVYRLCQLMRIAVPERVALVGVDDEPAVHSVVPLSSVRLRSREQGYEAAKLLDRLMKGGKPPRVPLRLPPVGLVARQTSELAAMNDPEVAVALRYIREHALERINVEDVLRHAALGRRTLERRFKKAVGRSPLEEINRIRIERAKMLLGTTELTVADIAGLAGFGGAEHLHHVFRSEIGMTPTGYRKGAKGV